MDLHVFVGNLEGCAFDVLDDGTWLEQLLRDAVRIGGFHLLHLYVHRFEPQGITAAAVLSESHIAIHTWPEHGILFLDMATCSSPVAARAALDYILKTVPHTRVISGAEATASRHGLSLLTAKPQ